MERRGITGIGTVSLSVFKIVEEEEEEEEEDRRLRFLDGDLSGVVVDLFDVRLSSSPLDRDEEMG
jgi:hypothetical protein